MQDGSRPLPNRVGWASAHHCEKEAARSQPSWSAAAERSGDAALARKARGLRRLPASSIQSAIAAYCVQRAAVGLNTPNTYEARAPLSAREVKLARHAPPLRRSTRFYVRPNQETRRRRSGRTNDPLSSPRICACHRHVPVLICMHNARERKSCVAWHSESRTECVNGFGRSSDAQATASGRARCPRRFC